MVEVVQKNKLFFVSYALLLSAGCYFLFSYPKDSSFLWINNHYSAAADFFFRFFTHLGDGLFYVLLVVAFFFINRNDAWIGLWSYAASSLVAQVLKRFIFPGQPRPKTFITDSSLIHFTDGVTVHGFNSFPSGHTATAFSIALWLSYISGNKYLSLLYLFLAALVGYSRVYLAQHFLEDVVAGSLIGILTTFIVIVLSLRYKQKRARY
jgi:membrane-associated phospholipid phosphatase